MSYTAPQYVDTKEQAILALASTIKGEAVTGGDGSVNRALDILADVLAEQDVQVPQTDAGAILALAQYASGMVKPEGTIEITENGEGIDVAQYATADVSVSGGGGGDFSTATMTIVQNGIGTAAVEVPCIHEGDLYAIQPITSGEYEVVLYKGKLVCYVAFGGYYAVTGNATFADDAITVTGDCTVTLSDTPIGDTPIG